MLGEVIKQINSATGDEPTATKEIYTWNQKSGQKASSSGTIYGIYDLSGGKWERTAAYTANGNTRLTAVGKSLLYNGSLTEEKNTKYVTVYTHAPDDETAQKNYEMAVNQRKFGNAMHEISESGTDNTSWYSDLSSFVGLAGPFSIRGGDFGYGSSSGLFSFRGDGGHSVTNCGFRAVLVGA